MWAAAFGRTDAVRALIAAGADPSGRSTFGGPDHGEGVTPLHLAAQGGHIASIELLLDAGADPSLRDALYGGTPENWAGPRRPAGGGRSCWPSAGRERVRQPSGVSRIT